MLERLDRNRFDELVHRNSRQLIGPRSTGVVRRSLQSAEDSDPTPTRRALRSPMAKDTPVPEQKPKKKTKYKFISKEKK